MDATLVRGRLLVLAAALVAFSAACDPGSGSGLPGSAPSTGAGSSAAAASPVAGPQGSATGTAVAYGLGRFPVAPLAQLGPPVGNALQAILDRAIPALPGLTATVIVAGRGWWSGAAGLADGQHPVEIDSKFGIASLTKTVIAAEILDLAEQGRLRLTDPVSMHLPADFVFDTNGATIANLLAMESGIPDPALNDTNYAADPARVWTVREVLATVPASRRPAGSGWVYEDANYMLLGLVIATVTGTTVSAALRSGVLADPRVAALVYQPEERPTGPLALPHVGGTLRADILQTGGGYLPSAAEASEGSGSGCMASDSATLALWGYDLFGGAILSQTSIEAMTDFGPVLPDPSKGRYGLGVFDQTNLANGFGVPTVGNGGWDDGGYSSVLSVIPGDGIAIAVLTNVAGDPKLLVMPIAQELAAAVR